jgi:hypothetical protein
VTVGKAARLGGFRVLPCAPILKKDKSFVSSTAHALTTGLLLVAGAIEAELSQKLHRRGPAVLPYLLCGPSVLALPPPPPTLIQYTSLLQLSCYPAADHRLLGI